MQDIKLGIIETGFIHPVIEKCVRKEDMGDKVMSNFVFCQGKNSQEYNTTANLNQVSHATQMISLYLSTRN